MAPLYCHKAAARREQNSNKGKKYMCSIVKCFHCSLQNLHQSYKKRTNSTRKRTIREILHTFDTLPSLLEQSPCILHAVLEFFYLFQKSFYPAKCLHVDSCTYYSSYHSSCKYARYETHVHGLVGNEE